MPVFLRTSSDTLALLFFAQVSRDRLLFVSYRTSYDISIEAVTNENGGKAKFAEYSFYALG